MPLLNIKTNIKLDNITHLAEQASIVVAELLGKPESYVMLNIQDEQCLMFGGSHDPCALLKLKSLGLDEALTTNFSKSLCEFINAQTAIETSRVYIEFHNPERHMWGWDSKTF